MTDSKLGILFLFYFSLRLWGRWNGSPIAMNWRTKTSSLCQAAGRVPGFCNRAIWQTLSRQDTNGATTRTNYKQKWNLSTPSVYRNSRNRCVIFSEKNAKFYAFTVRFSHLLHYSKQGYEDWSVYSLINLHIFSFISNGYMLGIKRFLRYFFPPQLQWRWFLTNFMSDYRLQKQKAYLGRIPGRWGCH